MKFPDPDESLEVTPQEVFALRETDPSAFDLVDCREDDELLLCKIEGAVHLALSGFPDVASNFARSGNPDQPVVVFCHHGMRSQHAARFLRQAGLRNTFSMAGGIERWSLEIDPEIRRY